MLVSDLIQSSLRKIGAISTGETPSSYTDTLQALQVMLRSWAQKKILVFASARESFNLVVAQSLYTWGVSGYITSTRPYQILSAFVRDSNENDIPMNIISEETYNSISVKTLTGRPSSLFYHPLYPQGNVYVYPVPQTIETVWVESLKPFTETSSFATSGDTISFPPNYEEALIYNLAIRIAPENGISISPAVGTIASDSYMALMGLNAANQLEPIRISLPAGRGRRYGGGYNINLGG